MRVDQAFLDDIRNKYARQGGVIAFLIACSSLLGIIGVLNSTQKRQDDNININYSGRQRTLTLAIINDVQSLIRDPQNLTLINQLNKNRALMQQGLIQLKLNKDKIQTNIKKSVFANSYTPNEINLYEKTNEFIKLSDPNQKNLSKRIMEIENLQKNIKLLV